MLVAARRETTTSVGPLAQQIAGVGNMDSLTHRVTMIQVTEADYP